MAALNNAEAKALFAAARTEAADKARYAEERAVKYIRTAKAEYEEGSPDYNGLIRLAEHDRRLRDQYLEAVKALAKII